MRIRRLEPYRSVDVYISLVSWTSADCMRDLRMHRPARSSTATHDSCLTLYLKKGKCTQHSVVWTMGVGIQRRTMRVTHMRGSHRTAKLQPSYRTMSILAQRNARCGTQRLKQVSKREASIVCLNINVHCQLRPTWRPCTCTQGTWAQWADNQVFRYKKTEFRQG